MSKTLDDIRNVGFIVSEIQRLRSLTIEDLREFFKGREMDRLYQFPHPSGRGSLVCGREAHFRTGVLTTRHLSTQPLLKAGADPSRFFRAVKEQITKSFPNNNRPINERNVARMLSAAVKAVSRKMYELTAYIPCVLVSNNVPDEFQIGPVRFIWMERFLSEHKDALNAKQPEIACLDLLEYYSTFRWVAEVTISNCDEPTSKIRASTVVEGALNVLRLMIGRRPGLRFRQGHLPTSPVRTAWLVRDKSNRLGISASWSSEEQHVKDNWFDELNKAAGLYLALSENALSGLVEPLKATHLTKRFLDALTWYGQAVTETAPGGSIVKCVASLERLTMTRIEDDGKISSTLIRRTARLVCNGDPNEYERSRSLINKIYTLQVRVNARFRISISRQIDQYFQPIVGSH